jgi:hypothetical protein
VIANRWPRHDSNDHCAASYCCDPRESYWHL